MVDLKCEHKMQIKHYKMQAKEQDDKMAETSAQSWQIMNKIQEELKITVESLKISQ